jgi:hypothetical protein
VCGDDYNWEGDVMNEQEAKKKAIEILKPVETRIYQSEWRPLVLAIQNELIKAFDSGRVEESTRMMFR